MNRWTTLPALVATIVNLQIFFTTSWPCCHFVILPSGRGAPSFQNSRSGLHAFDMHPIVRFISIFCVAGDKVIALLSGGGNAEYAAVHEDHLMPVGKMSMEEAAAIPEVWLTAYQLLHFVGEFT